MRGATSQFPPTYAELSISIHAPLCGERLADGTLKVYTLQFQSTLPYAGSDGYVHDRSQVYRNFNPRSPMRGATAGNRQTVDSNLFQSTLPYAGSDATYTAAGISSMHFNPRSPMRGATLSLAGAISHPNISIHAPLCGERPGSVV